MDASLNLVMDGVRLGAIGMITVFVFLTLLDAATYAMSNAVARFARPVEPDAEDGDGVRLAAVIAAAVRAHRDRS